MGMDWKATARAVAQALRSLPGIRLALLLGAGMVILGVTLLLTAIMAGWLAVWPVEAASVRATWLGIALVCAVVGLIVIGLAVGGLKLDKISVTSHLGSAEIDLADGTDPVDKVI